MKKMLNYSYYISTYNVVASTNLTKSQCREQLEVLPRKTVILDLLICYLKKQKDGLNIKSVMPLLNQTTAFCR